MTVHVLGTLRTPMGKPIAKAKIRITPTTVNDTTLPFMEGVAVTGMTGEYDFNLEDGSFLIELYQSNDKRYSDTSLVVVDSSVSSGPFTLEGLIAQFKKCVPDYPTCPVDPVQPLP